VAVFSPIDALVVSFRAGMAHHVRDASKAEKDRRTIMREAKEGRDPGAVGNQPRSAPEPVWENSRK
jgi:hypothetical protein